MVAATAAASEQRQQQQQAHATLEDTPSPALLWQGWPSLGRANNRWLRRYKAQPMLELLLEDWDLFQLGPPQGCSGQGLGHLDEAEAARKEQRRRGAVALALIQILRESDKAEKALRCTEAQGITASPPEPSATAGVTGDGGGCAAVQGPACDAQAVQEQGAVGGSSTEAEGQQPGGAEERDPWVLSWLAQQWEQRTACRVARKLRPRRQGPLQGGDELLPQCDDTQAQEQGEVDPQELLLRLAVAKGLKAAAHEEAATLEEQESLVQKKIELREQRRQEKEERWEWARQKRERQLEECGRRKEEKQRRKEELARERAERRAERWAEREEWKRQQEEARRRRWEQQAMCSWGWVWAPPPPPPPPRPLVGCYSQPVRPVPDDGLLGDRREGAENADADAEGAQLEEVGEGGGVRSRSVVGEGGAVAAGGVAGGVGLQAGRSAAQAPCRGWWRPWAAYGGQEAALAGPHVHVPVWMQQPQQWQQQQAVSWERRGQQQQGQHQEQQRERAVDGAAGTKAAATAAAPMQQQEPQAMSEGPPAPAPLLQPIMWHGHTHGRWLSRHHYGEEVRPVLQLLQQDWALFQCDAAGEGSGLPGAAEEARQVSRRNAAVLVLFEVLELSAKAEKALRLADAQQTVTCPPGPCVTTGAVGRPEVLGPACAAQPAQEPGVVGGSSAEAEGQQPGAAEERDPWVLSWLVQRWEQSTADRVAHKLKEVQRRAQQEDDALLLLPLLPQRDNTQAQEQGEVDPQELLLRLAVVDSLQEGCVYDDEVAAAKEQERLAPTRVRHDHHDQCRREKAERRELARQQREQRLEERRWRQEAKQRWKEELARERAERRAQREERERVPDEEHRRRLAQREAWKRQREEARRRREQLWDEVGCYSQPVRFVSAGLLGDGREEAEEVLAKAGETQQEAGGEAGAVVGEGGAVATRGVAGDAGGQAGSSTAQAPCRGWWRPWAAYGGPGPMMAGSHMHVQDMGQQRRQQQQQQGQQQRERSLDGAAEDGCEQHGGLGLCTAGEESLHDWLEEAYRSLGISGSHGLRELQQAYRSHHSRRQHHHHHQPHDVQLQECPQGQAAAPRAACQVPLPGALPCGASSALPTGTPCAQPDVAEEQECGSRSRPREEGEQQPRHHHHQHQQAGSAQGQPAQGSWTAVEAGVQYANGDLSYLSFLGSHFHPGSGYETEGARMERQQQHQDDHHRHSRCDARCSSAEGQPARAESPERATNATPGHADNAGGSSGHSSSNGGSGSSCASGPGDSQLGDGACVESNARGDEWCDGQLRPGLGLAGTGAAAGLSRDFARFEKHSLGIGSRLLLRMGWQPGQGLGPARHGRLEPLVPPRRPRALGLGADSWIGEIEPELPAAVADAGAAEAVGVTAVEVEGEVEVEVAAEAAAGVAAAATAEEAAAAASVAAAAAATAEEEVAAGCVPADVWEVIGA